MKTQQLKILVFTLLIAGLFASCKNKSEEQAVRDAFSEYKEAAKAGDVDKVMTYISQRTLGYSKKLYDMAMNSPKEELEQESMLTRMSVLGMRAMYGEKLKGMEQKELMSLGLSQSLGQMQKLFDKLKLKEIKVDGDQAIAEIDLGGMPTMGMTFDFVKEEGKWKWDVLALLNFVEKLMGDMLGTQSKMEMSEADMVMQALEAQGKEVVYEQVWKPINMPESEYTEEEGGLSSDDVQDVPEVTVDDLEEE